MVASALHCRLLISAVVMAVATLFAAGGADAACGDRDRIQCRAEFENINAVILSGDGFAAAGQLKRGDVLAPALLRLSRTGELKRTATLDWPGGRTPTARLAAEPRRLIAIPAGGFFVVGQLNDDVSSVGWAMRVADDGRLLWSKIIESAPNTVVVHAASYDSATDRLIVIGRLTQGNDDGRCERWSQSLVVTLKGSNGQEVVPMFTNGEQGRNPTNRQAIFDIVRNEQGGYIVAGFTTIATNRAPRRCLDNMFIGALNFRVDKWTLTTLGRIGAKDASEVAFSIKSAGTAGTYIVAGHRRDVPGEAPAAQAYRVRLAPSFGPLAPHLTTPFPPDGSDKTGGDRYRVVLPLVDKERFLLGGSASTSEKGLNQAIWQIVSADLRRNETPIMVTANGTDIFDAATSPEGRVLAVGRWTDDDGRRIGFTGFIGEGPLVFARRSPDSRLANLTLLAFSDDAYHLPPAAVSAGAGYYFGKTLAAGAQTDVRFSIGTNQTIKISAHAESGDLDLLVSDSAKRPVAFSNFKGSATELLITTLTPGEYTASVIAQTRVPSYEIRFGRHQEVDKNALAEVQRLSDDQRMQLADGLVSAGYAASAEPTITLGAEAVRSLIAAQEGAGPQRPIGPNGIGRSLSVTLGRP